MLQALGPLLVALTPNTFIAPAVTTPVRPRAAVFLEVVENDLIAKRKNAERLAPWRSKRHSRRSSSSSRRKS